MDIDDHGLGSLPFSTASSITQSNAKFDSSSKMKTFTYEKWSRTKGPKSVYQAARVVDFLRSLGLSAIEFFEIIIDHANTQFIQIQNALHREDSNALERILYAFSIHPHINERFEPWMKRHGVDMACELVAQEVMATSEGLQLPVSEITPEKLMGWSMGGKKSDSDEEKSCILDQMPTWTKILNVAVGDSQTKARSERTEERDTTVVSSSFIAVHWVQLSSC